MDGAAEDTLATATQMGWVSRFADDDPGVRQLNNRLISLQVELDDQLSHFRKDHPAVRSTEKKIRETIREILGEYREKTEGLETEREALLKEKRETDRELQGLPANEMRYARLMRRMEVKEELYTLLTKKHQEAMIAEAGAVDDVTVLSMATLPASPTNKDMARVAGVGVFLGLIFGIIFAIVREMFDTSIGTIEDVERALKLPVLAVIPHIHPEEQKERGGKKKTVVANENLRSFLVTHFNPKDPTAEAYRILRTNIEYLSFENPLRTILVTSATMQEGKSTTITNLAIAFAQQGKKVMLLECNLRRPSHQKIFGTDKGPGTSDVLIDKVEWRNCVRTVTDLALGDFSMEEILSIPGLDNLNSITYGHRPPNPTELLSSDKMARLLAELRESYDVVLVDAPPLLPVADSMVLSTKVDGVVLVYKVGKAPRNSLQLAKERLETVQANILGVILNDIRPETTGLTYSSYYMYAYGKDKDREPAKRRSRRQPMKARLL
jgi:tyrosine-protein kinase Etk/Wzc